ncbi:hypothetical protein ABLN87_18650 [Ruegeria sp. SCPT10]|uniref:hypothetical protein n=1 Tax=Ruegeria sp. SCP10 TaxID=3141377 RepID=UPI00333D20B1
MERRELTFAEIKSLATEAGERDWRGFLAHEQEVLAPNCMGYDRAWMFFRNSNIEIPQKASMKLCAIVVSKYGEVRTTADFAPNYTKRMEYLRTMSDHFLERDL